MKTYLPRIADGMLADRLKRKGAVQIKGAKWCGKTETAKQQAKSVLYLQDPDVYEQNMRAARVKPSLLLRGDEPRLIDEWQIAPQIWDAVRFAVDQDPEPGRFILTGSAVPGERPLHSGTGRFAFLTMRPMSLFESQESSGEVSLARLFDSSTPIEGVSSQTIEDIAFIASRGGWPASVLIPNRHTALATAQDYVEAICEEDISRVDGVSRNPDKARALLRSYARNIATQASDATLREDMSPAGETLSQPSLSRYLDALTDIFVIEELSAWNPQLRSKTAVRTSPTRCFVDPSIGVAALGASPDHLLQDLRTFGLLFETLCIRDIRVYADALGGHVFHYRDKSGLEADAVIVLDDGRWGLVEVKLGDAYVDEGSKNLRLLADKIDQQAMGSPAFLAVVTAEGYAYTRDDGVHVVPIGCLKP